MVSRVAWMMKRKRSGPSQLPWRTPMRLSTSGLRERGCFFVLRSLHQLMRLAVAPGGSVAMQLKSQALVRVPFPTQSTKRAAPQMKDTQAGAASAVLAAVAAVVALASTAAAATAAAASTAMVAAAAAAGAEAAAAEAGAEAAAAAVAVAAAAAIEAGGTWGWPYKGNSLLSHSLIKRLYLRH